MLGEECNYVVKYLICANNDAKYLIKIKCILLNYE